MNEPRLNNFTAICGSNGLTRRRFLKYMTSGAVLASASSSGLVQAAYSAFSTNKTLSLEHHHTGESLSRITYYENGNYLPDALSEISHFLRDYHNGEVYPIDPWLLDQLHDVKLMLGVYQPFHVVSGYRSPETNADLRRHSRGVAEHSLHMEGKAIDIRIAGISARTIRGAALALNRGGVGYYPRANFVHLDTGEVRTWRR